MTAPSQFHPVAPANGGSKLKRSMRLRLEADALLLLTDVAAVERDFGTPRAAPIAAATPEELLALGLPAGSMGPKVEAAAWFAQQTGGRAAIGRLEDASAVLRGERGTTVVPAVAGVVP